VSLQSHNVILTAKQNVTWAKNLFCMGTVE